MKRWLRRWLYPHDSRNELADAYECLQKMAKEQAKTFSRVQERMFKAERELERYQGRRPMSLNQMANVIEHDVASRGADGKRTCPSDCHLCHVWGLGTYFPAMKAYEDIARTRREASDTPNHVLGKCNKKCAMCLAEKEGRA